MRAPATSAVPEVTPLQCHSQVLTLFYHPDAHQVRFAARSTRSAVKARHVVVKAVTEPEADTAVAEVVADEAAATTEAPTEAATADAPAAPKPAAAAGERAPRRKFPKKTITVQDSDIAIGKMFEGKVVRVCRVAASQRRSRRRGRGMLFVALRA